MSEFLRKKSECEKNVQKAMRVNGSWKCSRFAGELLRPLEVSNHGFKVQAVSMVCFPRPSSREWCRRGRVGQLVLPGLEFCQVSKIKQESRGNYQGEDFSLVRFYFSFDDNCIPQCFYYFPNYFQKKNFFRFLNRQLPHEKACHCAVFSPGLLGYN